MNNEINTYKRCITCNETKDLIDFNTDKRKPDGRTTSCSVCVATVKRKRRRKIRDLNKEKTQECIKCHKIKPTQEFTGSSFVLRKKCNECRCEEQNKPVLFNDGIKKECSICREIKFIDKFPRRTNSYPYEYCLDCFEKTATPEDKELYETNLEKKRERERGYINKDPRHRMFSSAKARARDENFPFNLELDDIIIPEICPALGIKIQKSSGKPTDSSPSIDKIIPELGYVKGNVKVISYRANAIKRDASLDELEKIAMYVKNNSPLK